MEVNELASSLFGYASIACWVIVLVPQIRLNHRRKSCDGVSLAFYLMWSLGDLFNLAGALMGGLILTAVLLPIYYIVTDCIVLWQFYIYRHGADPAANSNESSSLLAHAPLPSSSYSHNGCQEPLPKPAARRILRSRSIMLIFSLVLLAAMFVIHYATTRPEWLEHIDKRRAAAQLCGYISAAVYLSAYVPQLIRNYKSKSTEGLSLLMFILVILANTTFCLSVLTSQKPTYEHFQMYASWLLGAAGTIVLELAVLYQFYLYRHSQQHLLGH
ncbi:putative vacuolar membrane transporter for cationic amino acids [Coemansia thaxteri]|nr:putative vacuolar membrane transporter for cationic amino acids [Coemansia thaxteri]